MVEERKKNRGTQQDKTSPMRVRAWQYFSLKLLLLLLLPILTFGFVQQSRQLGRFQQDDLFFVFPKNNFSFSTLGKKIAVKLTKQN